MSIEINEGTQTTVNTSLVGGTETQVIRVDVGSGTTTAEFGGTVRDVANITKGTVTRVEGGTITTSNPTGTVVEVNKGTINLGTVAVSSLPTSGTIVRVGNVGTLEVGTFTNTGTVVNVATGTINVGTATVSGNVGVSTGTITTGSITNVATLHNGTVVMPSGTVTSVTNIVGGTIGSVLGIGGTVQVSGASAGTYVNIVTGTQQTLGTVGTVPGIGTITNLGSVTNAGTIKEVGKAFVVGATASGGTPTTAPVLVAGTDATGTVYAPIVSSAGALKVDSVAAGTTIGTITTGTLQNLVSGTINALASGTITAGTVAVTVGSVVGPNASAGTSTTAPVQIGGTTATGTVYEMLVDTSGNPQVDVVNTPTVNMASGTLNVGTTTVSGNVGVSTGTITTGSLSNVAMLNAGTIDVVSNLVKGTITKVEGGTLGEVTLVPTVTTVSNLTNGSVRMTLGTLTTGSITDVAKVYSGTINAGTIQSNPTPPITVVNQGTLGTSAVAVWGTLSGASGAGTFHYVTGVSIVVQSGTVDTAISFGTTASNPLGTGVLTRGAFSPGLGVARTFIPVISGGANSELTYWLGGAGTAYFVINYWKAT